MQSVNVVTLHDVGHDGADIVAVVLQGRVEDEHPVEVDEALGVFLVGVLQSQALGPLRFGAVWVDPCVQLHAALMALVYHPLQGVPEWFGSHTLLACQVAAPWLVVGEVERIGLGAHLEDDGVDTCPLQRVELCGKGILHLSGSHPYELSVDGLYPCSAELAL